MKKFLSAALIALVVTLSANCSAKHHSYYDNDPNYVFVTTSQGHIYLDLRTIDVQEYNPPYYKIAGLFTWTRNDGYGTENKFTLTVRYDLKKKETFGLHNGYWRKSDTEGDNASARRNRRMADALFRAAYGMDFYGY